MRTLKGTVVSTKMDKTIVIAINTYKSHPLYKKRYKMTQKFYAHDETGIAKEGDVVTISETRPLSKTKRWMLVESK
jgi:small subunit ribosomal protein S17